MKRALCRFLILFSTLTLFFTMAMAASYDGRIWTGKPTIIGTGYYCTAAQNKSGGDVSTHFAKAKTWKTINGTPVNGAATGNNRAVASTGSTKPVKGWGQYGETGWSTEGIFAAGAWD